MLRPGITVCIVISTIVLIVLILVFGFSPIRVSDPGIHVTKVTFMRNMVGAPLGIQRFALFTNDGHSIESFPHDSISKTTLVDVKASDVHQVYVNAPHTRSFYVSFYTNTDVNEPDYASCGTDIILETSTGDVFRYTVHAENHGTGHTFNIQYPTPIKDARRFEYPTRTNMDALRSCMIHMHNSSDNKLINVRCVGDPIQTSHNTNVIQCWDECLGNNFCRGMTYLVNMDGSDLCVHYQTCDDLIKTDGSTSFMETKKKSI